MALAPHLASLDPNDAGIVGFYRGVFEGRLRYWALCSLHEGHLPVPTDVDETQLLWARRPLSVTPSALAPPGAASRASLDRLPQPLSRALASARKRRKPDEAWVLAAAIDAAFGVYLRLVWYGLVAVCEVGSNGPASLRPPIHRSVLEAILALLPPSDDPRTAPAVALQARLVAQRPLAAELVTSVERLTHLPGPMAATMPQLLHCLALLEVLLVGSGFHDATVRLVDADDATRNLVGFPSLAAPVGARCALACSETALLPLTPYVRTGGLERDPRVLLADASHFDKKKGLSVQWLGVSREGLLEQVGDEEWMPAS